MVPGIVEVRTTGIGALKSTAGQLAAPRAATFRVHEAPRRPQPLPEVKAVRIGTELGLELSTGAWVFHAGECGHDAPDSGPVKRTPRSPATSDLVGSVRPAPAPPGATRPAHRSPHYLARSYTTA